MKHFHYYLCRQMKGGGMEITMRKKFLVCTTTAAIALSMNLTAFAGQWMQNSTGWWFDNGNGTYPANVWQWIDGNGDGVAECYYFDQYGYCLMNTRTSDGYEVNASGAWVVDGVVQTRIMGSIPEVAEKDALYLNKVSPIISAQYEITDNIETNKEHRNWTKVVNLKGYRAPASPAYAEYYAGREYTKFKASVAPGVASTWEKDSEALLQIFGDDEELLYEENIRYSTNIFDIDVDISGQDSITLMITSDGRRGNVIFKDARFE